MAREQTPRASPHAGRVAVLLTDWGTPEGFDYGYGVRVARRSLLGEPAKGEPCEDTFVGKGAARTTIGLLPPAMLTDHSADEAVFAQVYDIKGLYAKNAEAGDYESLFRHDDGTPVHVITQAQAEAHHLEIIPLIDSPDQDAPLTGRTVFKRDPRDGRDVMEGIFQIELPSTTGLTPRGNGIRDIDEFLLANYIRSARIASSDPEHPHVNATVERVEQRTAELLRLWFGSRVDVRAGKYAAFRDLTRDHEQVALDFVKEGFTKLLLTRETTDHNNYANRFVTRNYVERALCRYTQEAGGPLDVRIEQVHQVGRTPEYNRALLEVLRPHLDAIPKHQRVAVLYTTYGLPWPGSPAASEEEGDFGLLFKPPHPSAAEVYHENAYLNFLSFKRYAEAELGTDHELVFTANAKSDEQRTESFFAYSMFGPHRFALGGPPFGYKFGQPLEDPYRFLTLREQINRAKAAGHREIVALLSHWYYSSYLTTVNIRDVNGLPYTPRAELDRGKYTAEWCEDKKGEQLAPKDGRCPKSHPFHLQLSETFDNRGLPDAFALAYASVIRGGVERLGELPSLGIEVAAQAAISKSSGGNVRVSEGPLRGAALEIAPDPAPTRPEQNDPMEVIEGRLHAFNGPNDIADSAWFDFTAFIGTQREGVQSEPQGRASQLVLIGPYRTIVNKPARVSLPYDPALVADTNTLRPMIYNELTGTWDRVYDVAGGTPPTVDFEAHTVSFDTQVLGLFALASL